MALALLVAGTLAGCSSDPAADGSLPCGSLPTTTTVTEVRAPDIVVQDGDLVLHAAEASVRVHDADGCRPIAVADIRAGDWLGHDATQIAESYPAQAWPDNIVIDRR